MELWVLEGRPPCVPCCSWALGLEACNMSARKRHGYIAEHWPSPCGSTETGKERSLSSNQKISSFCCFIPLAGSHSVLQDGSEFTMI